MIPNVNHISLGYNKFYAYGATKLIALLIINFVIIGIIIIIVALLLIRIRKRNKNKMVNAESYNTDSKKKSMIDLLHTDKSINEEESLLKDKELIAVITAAIMAYQEDENNDGLVIRSIRKSNRRKQRNEYSTYI